MTPTPTTNPYILDIQESLKETGWVGTLDETIRDNLIWHKENGNDHGDLVIAEEAIKAKINFRIISSHISLLEKVLGDTEEKIKKRKSGKPNGFQGMRARNRNAVAREIASPIREALEWAKQQIK